MFRLSCLIHVNYALIAASFKSECQVLLCQKKSAVYQDIRFPQQSVYIGVVKVKQLLVGVAGKNGYIQLFGMNLLCKFNKRFRLTKRFAATEGDAL